MFRRLSVAVAATMLFTGAALADPIEGNWRTETGSTAKFSPCGGSFCIKLTTGEHAGKSIGKLSATGGNKYRGEITDPADDKTYTGKATLNGNSLRMQGCVFGGLICQSQTWTRI
ncbi:MAG: DUF2147 domain-containing protein [Rhizobiaceae bacterium]|nr:MAG: DUF2147 domain-containing protein [Rhizobiaceae bacterium]CAG1015968.1 hypothetical protein RHIZO_05224 [Rhizobiaceae bacterium]